MNSKDTSHAAALERARGERAPYHQAVQYGRWGGGKLVWLYAIGWPTVLSFGYGIPCLVQGDLRDGMPALAFGASWGLVVLGVVSFVTGSIRAAGRRLEAFAARVSGLAFRSSFPDRVLAWLDRYWADDVPRSIIHDPSGSAYFVGAEVTYGNAPVLILGVRGSFWPRVHQIVLFAAPGARRPDELARARVELGQLGYVVSTTRSGVLATREHAPASAFEFETLDAVVHLLAEVAGTPRSSDDAETKRALRAELRALSIERFKHVYHFDEAELKLNAGGRLSARQRVSSAVRGTLWGAAALAAAGWAFHVAFAILGPGEHKDVGGGIIVIVVSSLIALALTVVAGQILRDAVDGHAGLVFGPLRHTTTTGSKGGVHHWLHCGHLRFSASAAVIYAIESEVPYRVYYSAHSHRLLSLERADAS